MVDLCRHVTVRDSGKPDGCIHPVPSPSAQLSSIAQKFSVSEHPALRFQQGSCISELKYRSLALQPADLFASLVGADRIASANRDFYFRASSESIALLTAGYRYDGNWVSSTGWTSTSKIKH